jgi:hypothetical protein
MKRYRSVKVIDNKMYTGGYMEFGFGRENQMDNLSTSLSQSIKIKFSTTNNLEYIKFRSMGNFSVVEQNIYMIRRLVILKSFHLIINKSLKQILFIFKRLVVNF